MPRYFLTSFTSFITTANVTTSLSEETKAELANQLKEDQEYFEKVKEKMVDYIKYENTTLGAENMKFFERLTKTSFVPIVDFLDVKTRFQYDVKKLSIELQWISLNMIELLKYAHEWIYLPEEYWKLLPVNHIYHLGKFRLKFKKAEAGTASSVCFKSIFCSVLDIYMVYDHVCNYTRKNIESRDTGSLLLFQGHATHLILMIQELVINFDEGTLKTEELTAEKKKLNDIVLVCNFNNLQLMHSIYMEQIGNKEHIKTLNGAFVLRQNQIRKQRIVKKYIDWNKANENKPDVLSIKQIDRFLDKNMIKGFETKVNAIPLYKEFIKNLLEKENTEGEASADQIESLNKEIAKNKEKLLCVGLYSKTEIEKTVAVPTPEEIKRYYSKLNENQSKQYTDSKTTQEAYAMKRKEKRR